MPSKAKKRLRNLQKELELLDGQKTDIASRITGQKIEIARKKGSVVKKAGDLKCWRHLDSRFVKIGEIKGGNITLLRRRKSLQPKPLKIYGCEQCQNDKASMRIGDYSRGYECPQCRGIVKGDFEVRPYSFSQKKFGKGVQYFCRVCGLLLGKHFWEFS